MRKWLDQTCLYSWSIWSAQHDRFPSHSAAILFHLLCIRSFFSPFFILSFMLSCILDSEITSQTRRQSRRTFLPLLFVFDGMLLQCCWRGLSPALLGAAFATHSNRSCSYQLSNNINKKIDGPRRECTYGPKGLCRLSRGLLNYGEQYRLWKIIRQQPIAELEKQLTLP